MGRASPNLTARSLGPIFRQACSLGSRARIDGVEHDPRWFEQCRALEAAFPDSRVRMYHRRLAIAPGRAEGYVTWPLYDPDARYDLIFIDGRLRCDCAAVARLVLAKGGTVLVHDAHRPVYQPAFGLYPEREVVYNTAVLGMAGKGESIFHAN